MPVFVGLRRKDRVGVDLLVHRLKICLGALFRHQEHVRVNKDVYASLRDVPKETLRQFNDGPALVRLLTQIDNGERTPQDADDEWTAGKIFDRIVAAS